MFGLWPTIPAGSNMSINQSESLELIAALRAQFEKVREMTAWLELKQSELRPDDEFSFFGLLEAKQNLALEQSLLAGHAVMLQQDMQASGIIPDPETSRLLQEIAKSVRSRYLI